MAKYNKFLIALLGGFASIIGMFFNGLDVASIQGLITVTVPGITAVLVALIPNVGDSFDKAATYVYDAKELMEQIAQALPDKKEGGST